jgi:putative glutamine amidotransferase
VFELLDGLLLAGDASDVDPGRYNDWPQEKLGRVDPRKDRAEIELFNLAFNKNIPVFGICRGIQVMNIALDGTLYQDIGSQVRMALNHNPKFPPTERCHRVVIEDGTKLHQIIGETDIRVNSSHHQAVKLHGKGLNVNAKASDGITEGIEHPGKKWVIGIQWHPELMYRSDRASEQLFRSFVDACKS